MLRILATSAAARRGHGGLAAINGDHAFNADLKQLPPGVLHFGREFRIEFAGSGNQSREPQLVVARSDVQVLPGVTPRNGLEVF